MIYQASRWAGIIVIVSTVTGCDNVTWGGIDMGLEPPPPPPTRVETPAEVEPEPAAVPLPDHPILYWGTLAGGEATLQPLAILVDGGLQPIPFGTDDPGFKQRFVDAFLHAGAEFTVFAGGGRIGTFISSGEVRGAAGTCGDLPEVRGVTELRPGAAAATRVLALPRSIGTSYAYGSYRTERSSREQRVASLNLAADLIPRLGIPWPGSVLEIRRDIQVFTTVETRPGLAATFVLGDELQVGAGPSGAYSLFVYARDDGTGAGYRPAHVLYQKYDNGGKAAPRYFDQMDLDQDGGEEIFLEVFGENARWMSVASERGGKWVTIFESRCDG